MGDVTASIYQKIQSDIRSDGNIGNYRIIRKIGEGTYSNVFLAEHVMTKHIVVLKSAGKDQANLTNEIINMGYLEHPHIVRLYEFIVTPTTVFLVLEYCEGHELYHYLQNSEPTKKEYLYKLFAQLVGAVAYTHSMNCAHRDLKLENVLLDTFGNIKLGDFGFTRNYSPRSMLDTICGTESYMAPELILRKRYHPESVDVWALGVILYALIYKKLPFDSDNIAETTRWIVEEEPEFPDVDGLHDLVSLNKLILQKSPTMRPKLIRILDLLGEEGKNQRVIIQNIPSRRDKAHFMVTKEERSLLKGMKALNIDLSALALSIAYHKCDSLHGLWFTALDKQRAQSGNNRDNSSTSKYKLTRTLSKASITSHFSSRMKTPQGLNTPDLQPKVALPQQSIDPLPQPQQQQQQTKTSQPIKARRSRRIFGKFVGVLVSRNIGRQILEHHTNTNNTSNNNNTNRALPSGVNLTQRIQRPISSLPTSPVIKESYDFKQHPSTPKNNNNNKDTESKPSTPSRTTNNDRTFRSSLSPFSSQDESMSPGSINAPTPHADHSSFPSNSGGVNFNPNYSGLGVSVSRPMSTYSQLSQLSQSSAEPSVLLNEVQQTQEPYFMGYKERSKSIPTLPRRFTANSHSVSTPDMTSPTQNRMKFRQLMASGIQTSTIDESDVE